MIIVEDDKPAVKMTEQAGESGHDCVKTQYHNRGILAQSYFPIQIVEGHGGAVIMLQMLKRMPLVLK